MSKNLTLSKIPMLTAISPIDGRYAYKTSPLSPYFSEFALIRYRLLVEVEYFIALREAGIPQLKNFAPANYPSLRKIYQNFSPKDGEEIKSIEKTTNHDVKAVEYFLKDKMIALGWGKFTEFVHFGLTSQDINNTAFPLMFNDANVKIYYPTIEKVIARIETLAQEWKGIPMLAKTHGQPASPTTLGKEMKVFSQRLKIQLDQLKAIPYSAKFGGATGNMNAHLITFPNIDWHKFADHFINEQLGLSRSNPTTQIEHYDNLAAQFHAMTRINTILIDFSRDIWTYISMNYFGQKVVKNEVGSSAMPHKVNPIDFENAEGNLGIANALLIHLAGKLPVSRLQRDLTDSTVLRNIGVPVAHTIISLTSLLKGIDKLILNKKQLEADLNANWAVVTEAIQNILRRENFEKPYEALKALSRGNQSIGQIEIHQFIDNLPVKDKVKNELKAITPLNYLGYF